MDRKCSGNATPAYVKDMNHNSVPLRKVRSFESIVTSTPKDPRSLAADYICQTPICATFSMHGSISSPSLNSGYYSFSHSAYAYDLAIDLNISTRRFIAFAPKRLDFDMDTPDSAFQTNPRSGLMSDYHLSPNSFGKKLSGELLGNYTDNFVPVENEPAIVSDSDMQLCGQNSVKQEAASAQYHDSSIVRMITSPKSLLYMLPKLLGRRILNDNDFDIVGVLGRTNYAPVVAAIVRHLDPVDLINMRLVNKNWCHFVDRSVDAQRKIDIYRDVRAQESLARSLDENYGNDLPRLRRTPEANINLPLRDISNELEILELDKGPYGMCIGDGNPNLQKSTGNPLDESHRRCPLCSGMAVVKSDDDQCRCEHCKYNFCNLCRNKYHIGTPCRSSASKKSCLAASTAVSSGGSKKNLKRL